MWSQNVVVLRWTDADRDAARSKGARRPTKGDRHSDQQTRSSDSCCQRSGARIGAATVAFVTAARPGVARRPTERVAMSQLTDSLDHYLFLSYASRTARGRCGSDSSRLRGSSSGSTAEHRRREQLDARLSMGSRCTFSLCDIAGLGELAECSAGDSARLGERSESPAVDS